MRAGNWDRDFQAGASRRNRHFVMKLRSMLQYSPRRYGLRNSILSTVTGCISDEVRANFPDFAYSSITARYRALLDKNFIADTACGAWQFGSQAARHGCNNNFWANDCDRMVARMYTPSCSSVNTTLMEISAMADLFDSVISNTASERPAFRQAPAGDYLVTVQSVKIVKANSGTQGLELTFTMN